MSIYRYNHRQAVQRMSELFYRRTCLIADFPDGQPALCQKYICGWARSLAQKIHSHISSAPLLNFTRGQKSKIWPRFSTPVVFQSVLFRHAAYIWNIKESQKRRWPICVLAVRPTHRWDPLSHHRTVPKLLSRVLSDFAIICQSQQIQQFRNPPRSRTAPIWTKYMYATTRKVCLAGSSRTNPFSAAASAIAVYGRSAAARSWLRNCWICRPRNDWRDVEGPQIAMRRNCHVF